MTQRSSSSQEPRHLGVLAAMQVRANPSLSPRPATAGVVSPAPDFRSIIGHRAYAACLRGRG